MRNISGDVSLSFVRFAAYMFSNLIINIISDLFLFFAVRKYFVVIKLHEVKDFSWRESPSRILCRIFLRNWFKDKSCTHVVDLGCGDHWIGSILAESTDTVIQELTGVDLKGPKKIPYSRFKIDTNVEGVHAWRPSSNVDLIVSQSFLEHVEDYISVLEKGVGDGCAINQLHLVPGPSTLLAYGPHGYRQFNAFDLYRIIKRFGKDYNIRFISFGVSGVFRCHLTDFTLPRLMRRFMQAFGGRFAVDAPHPVYSEDAIVGLKRGFDRFFFAIELEAK